MNSNIYYKGVFALLLLLLFLGVGFSKLYIGGSVDLYDVLLIVLSAVAVFTFKKKLIRFRAIFIFFAFAIIYFVKSVLAGYELMLSIRQFMLFGYIMIAYFLILQIVEIKGFPLEKMVIKISKYSFYLQAIYVLYWIFILKRGLNTNDKIYYSPLAIMGVLTFIVYSLIYEKKIIYKYCYVSVSLLLCFLTNHASALLAGVIIVFLYAYHKINPLQKFFIVILGVLSFVYVITDNQQFNDSNASWRKILWVQAGNTVFNKNLGVVGEGFGVKYVSDQTILMIIGELGADILDRDNNAFVTPPHNSFLTMCFHIGFLPCLIIFIPLARGLFKYLYQKLPPLQSFWILSIIGLSVWSFFNVILELPHSSLFYWVVYFGFYCTVIEKRNPAEK